MVPFSSCVNISLVAKEILAVRDQGVKFTVTLVLYKQRWRKNVEDLILNCE
jgi:hypothetical protein